MHPAGVVASTLTQVAWARGDGQGGSPRPTLTLGWTVQPSRPCCTTCPPGGSPPGCPACPHASPTHPTQPSTPCIPSLPHPPTLRHSSSCQPCPFHVTHLTPPTPTPAQSPTTHLAELLQLPGNGKVDGDALAPRAAAAAQHVSDAPLVHILQYRWQYNRLQCAVQQRCLSVPPPPISSPYRPTHTQRPTHLSCGQVVANKQGGAQRQQLFGK